MSFFDDFRPEAHLLKRLAAATNPKERERYIDALLECSRPILDRWCKSRFPDPKSAAEDIEDVRAAVQLALSRTLCTVTPDKPIGHFPGYVTRVADHAFCSWIDQLYPELARLKRRVRYLVGNHPNLCVWKHKEKCWVRLQDHDPTHMRDYREAHLMAFRAADVLEDVQALKAQLLQQIPEKHHEKAETGCLLVAMLTKLRTPAPLMDVIKLLADLQGIAVGEHVALEDLFEDDIMFKQASAARTVNAEEEAVLRERLCTLWEAICQLEMSERRTLLFQLRDNVRNRSPQEAPVLSEAYREPMTEEKIEVGEVVHGVNLLIILVKLGIVGCREIADKMQLEWPAEFQRVWEILPMSDSQIAAFMNITGDKVRALRFAARRHLSKNPQIRDLFGTF